MGRRVAMVVMPRGRSASGLRGLWWGFDSTAGRRRCTIGARPGGAVVVLISTASIYTPATLAPLMGHSNSRMIEEVYGQLRAAAVMLERLRRELGLTSIECAASVPSASEKTAIGGTPENSPTAVFPLYKLAPRVGFEPTTRGLTVRSSEWASPRDAATLRESTQGAVPLACRRA